MFGSRKQLHLILSALIISVILLAPASSVPAQNRTNNVLTSKIDKLAQDTESKVTAWRRDIHANPELGNREFRTSKLVADHLKSLGMKVQSGHLIN